jgi:hypothetical protein
MTAFVKIVIEQGAAFLVGLLFVTIVQPETTGGVLLLLVIAIAIVNVFIIFVKWRLLQTKRSAVAEVGKVPEARVSKAEIAKTEYSLSSRAASGKDQQRAEAAETSTKRKIFISYRRRNDAALAGRISDLLAGECDIFMDVDAIRLGTDFVEAINEEVAKCDVVIAVIGRDWLDALDETGNRRLDDPNDFVRIEIAAALQRQIPVVPILVDSAKMPNAAQLPANLQSLARRNALDLRNASFKADMGRLVQELKAEAKRN